MCRVLLAYQHIFFTATGRRSGLARKRWGHVAGRQVWVTPGMERRMMERESLQ